MNSHGRELWEHKDGRKGCLGQVDEGFKGSQESSRGGDVFGTDGDDEGEVSTHEE